MSGSAPTPVRVSSGRRWGMRAFFLLLVLALAGGFAYTEYSFPDALVGPPQPIPFSHRIHANVKQIDCQFCHSFAARANHAGLPEVAKCFYCHEYIIPDHPWIKHEREYFEKNQPVPWVRTMLIPDHVHFRHRPHIEAGVDCGVCHGNVKSADRLPEIQFPMGFCIDCHRQHDAPVGCWMACHT